MFIRPSHSYARASILKTGVLLPTVCQRLDGRLRALSRAGRQVPCTMPLVSTLPSRSRETVERERERIEPSNLGAWLGRPVVGPPSLLRPPGVAVQKLASPFACALPAAQACALQGCSCSRLPAEVQRQRQGSGPAPLDAPLEPRTEHCRYQGSERES